MTASGRLTKPRGRQAEPRPMSAGKVRLSEEPRASSTEAGVRAPTMLWEFGLKRRVLLLRCRHTPTGGLFDFWLSLAFLRWCGCAWIAAFINHASSGLTRCGNRIAFVFGTRGAYGCAGSAGCVGVGRMRDAESQRKKDSGSN